MNSSDSHHRVKNFNEDPVFHTGCTRIMISEMPKSVTCEKCGNSLPNVLSYKHNLNEVQSKYCMNCTNQNSLNSSKSSSNHSNFKSPNSLYSPSNSTSHVSSKCETFSHETPKPVKRRSLLPYPVYNAKQSYHFQEQSAPPKFEQSYSSPSPHSSYEKSGSKRKSDCQQDFVKRIRSASPAVPCKVQHSNYNDELSRGMWQLFHERKQTKETYEMKMALRNQLHDMLLSKFPNCDLYVVGSSMTGLGSNDSDMDMCLMLTDSVVGQKKEAIHVLFRIRSLFRNCKFIRDCQVIPARVPILRFRDSVSGIEVDLNVNNSVGIKNTQLLLSYARIDKRLAPLVVLIKLWAKSHSINDAKNYTLSSYSLVLMVVHYLQYACKPPVLPCLQKLQPDKYHPDANVGKLKLYEVLPHFNSENKEDIGNLFRGFLEYFSKKYDYCKSVISVRLGCLSSREESESTLSSPNQNNWKFLCIEEPFDLSNTARSVFKAEEFYYIRQVFENSLNTLNNYGDIKYLL